MISPAAKRGNSWTISVSARKLPASSSFETSSLTFAHKSGSLRCNWVKAWSRASASRCTIVSNCSLTCSHSSGTMRLLTQCAVKPSPRYSPIALHGTHANAQSSGDLLFREAGNKAHLHNPGLARIDGFQTLERFVQGQELHRSGLGPDWQVGESDLETGIGTFLRIAGSRVIDENAPHQPCGDGEKVRPAFPVD